MSRLVLRRFVSEPLGTPLRLAKAIMAGAGAAASPQGQAQDRHER